MTAFLRQRLAIERRVSAHTCETYAYGFQLLFEFASGRLNVAPSDIHLEQIDAPLILAFLEHLQVNRGNTPRTRNARLAAIKSFMRFIEHRVPAALEQVRRIVAIPSQKVDTRIVHHLEEPEFQAILDTPDPTTRLGIRDRAMLHVALSAGLRVSELVGLRMEDVTFEGRYVHLLVRGKGRRERVLNLWKAVATSLRAWLAVRGAASAPEVFLNAWGDPMTRWGFECVLTKHVAAAASACPSLRNKRVSPHVLRHTCAFNTLRSTRDIRQVALWLGHATTQTADVHYLQADPSEKLDILAAVPPLLLRPGKFRPQDRLIASLRGS
jgi:site-specific recombinase XerD